VILVAREGGQVILIQLQVEVGHGVIMRPFILWNFQSFHWVRSLHMVQLIRDASTS
jgi:hypothetical protein